MKSHKSIFFSVLPGILGLVAVLFSAGCAGRSSAGRIILISIDSLRADRLTAYGAETSLMPRLDQLAAGGTLFTEAWSPSPLTLPAVAGMMTGRLPSSVGVVDDEGSVLHGDAPLLAARLLEAGWATGMFANAPFLHENSGLHEGFRRVFNPATGEPRFSRDAPSLFSQALTFLDTQRTVPTFAWIHIYDTHYPYLGTGVTGIGADRYDAALAAADQALARFLQNLEEQDLSRDALIVVVGDHGEALGERGEGTHGQNLSPAVLHVPLVIAEPGADSGRQVDDPVSLLDMAPTLAALAGLPAWPQGGPLAGRSLAPLLRGEQDAAGTGRTLAAESYAPSFSYHWAPLVSVLQNGRWQPAPPGTDGLPPLPDLGPEDARLPSDEARRQVLRAADEVARALAAGHYTEAEQLLAAFPEAARDTPMSARLLAALQRALGQPAAAMASLTAAAQAAPQCADLWLAKARLEDDLGRPSLESWQQAAAAAGSRVQFHLHAARQLLARGRADEALLAAREAAAGRAPSATLDRALGRTALYAGRIEEAQRLLADAAIRRPGSVATYRALARVAAANEAEEGAVSLLQEALRIDPLERSLHQDLGDLHALAGRSDAARQSWRQALPDGSEEPASSLTVAEHFLRLGLMDEAAADVDAVRVHHPDSAQGHYIMGQVALTRRDPQGAREELLAALRTGGEQAVIYYALARAALLQENEEEALNYLERVFAADDPLLRRSLRTERLLTAPGTFPRVALALEQYLAGGAAPTTADATSREAR